MRTYLSKYMYMHMYVYKVNLEGRYRISVNKHEMLLKWKNNMQTNQGSQIESAERHNYVIILKQKFRNLSLAKSHSSLIA